MAKKAVAPQKKVRDAPFAKRLNEACDNHPDCPPLHYGRLSWLVSNFKSKFSVDITSETARKWIAGEVRPRPSSMSLLAQLLEIDLAWLAVGSEGDVPREERKVRNAMADGAVNLVAGMIATDGGHPAFPDPDDPRAKSTDLFAIIKGAQYAFKVTVGHPNGGKSWLFSLPNNYRDVFVIGLVRVGPFHWDVLELDAETITKNRENKGGQLAITADKRGAAYTVGGHKLRQLESFADRP